MDTNVFFEFIFIILVYRNIDDLIECIKSINYNVQSYKIIVVNAYYNEESKDKIQSIALKYNCDFLNIQNKGYGFGNNAGIEFAKSKYDYSYIVISNPDIIIKKWDESLKFYGIIAPKIITLSNKSQNPMVIKNNQLSQYFVYLGFKKDIYFFVCIGIIMGKISNYLNRLPYQIRKKYKFKIYTAHGSFVIIDKKTIELLHPIYDEEMFLFAEEGVLAKKASAIGVETLYTEKIEILHKEDGSMNLSDISQNIELKKANIYFYEHYIKSNLL